MDVERGFELRKRVVQCSHHVQSSSQLLPRLVQRALKQINRGTYLLDMCLLEALSGTAMAVLHNFLPRR
jgi:hypothetical protein